MTAELHRLTAAGPLLGKPEQSVIEALEGLLVEARAGRMKAFAYAYVDDQDFIRTQWAAGCARPSQLAAGVARLFYDFMKADAES